MMPTHRTPAANDVPPGKYMSLDPTQVALLVLPGQTDVLVPLVDAVVERVCVDCDTLHVVTVCVALPDVSVPEYSVGTA